MKGWKGGLKPLALALAVLLPSLSHLIPLALGRVHFFGDILLWFIPWRTFARDQILFGHMPLWNPYSFCGQPFLANLQSALLYPPNLLLLPLPPDAAVHASILLHASWAGLGMFLLARAFGLSEAPSLLSSLAFSISGFFVTKLQFPSMFCSISWAPWTFLFAWRCGKGGSLRPLLGLGASLALSFLAGHAQIVLITGLAALVLASLNGWRGLLKAVIACSLSVSLCVAQLLPTMELVFLSPRAAMSFEEAMRFSLPPWQVLGFLSFGAFGHPSWAGYFGVGNYWETCGYLGPLVLALAFALPLQGRVAKFALGMALAGLILSFGRYFPLLQRALWLLLPSFRLFHDPARFLLLTSLGAALLAGFGLEAILRGSEKALSKANRFLFGVALFSLVAMASGALLPFLAPKVAVRLTESLLDTAQLDYRPELLPDYARYFVLLPAMRAFVFLLLLSGFSLPVLQVASKGRPLLAIGLLSAELLFHALLAYPTVPLKELRASFGRLELSLVDGPLSPRYAIDRGRLKTLLVSRMGYVRFPTNSEGTIEEVVSSLAPNVNVALSIPCVSGYDPLPSERASQAAKLAERLLTERGDPRLALALGAKWLVLPGFEGRTEARLLSHFHRLPFYSVGRCVILRSFEEFQKAVWGGKLDLRREVALESPPSPSPRAVANSIQGKWLREGPQFEVLSREPTLLVTGISAYPGWRALIDGGEEAKLLVANWCLIALPLHAGRHTVRMFFHPASFSVGLYISLLTLAGFASWLIATSPSFPPWKNRRQNRPS